MPKGGSGAGVKDECATESSRIDKRLIIAVV
jgi:hypothetical protein